MKRDSANTISIAVLSILAGAYPLLVIPYTHDQSLALKIVVAIFGGLLYSGLFFVVRKIVATLGNRKLIKDGGLWYYVTNPHESSTYKDGNFARMTFFINWAGELNYRAELFKSLSDLGQPETSQSTGMSHNLALDYSQRSRELSIIYFLKIFSEEELNISRMGRLQINLSNMTKLTGEWTSEVKHYRGTSTKRLISSGTLTAFRSLEDLKKFVNT